MKDVKNAMELAVEVRKFWDELYANQAMRNLTIEQITEMENKLRRYSNYQHSLSFDFEGDSDFKVTKEVRKLTAIFLRNSGKADLLQQTLKELREKKASEAWYAAWESLTPEEKEARSKATRKWLDGETKRTGIPF